jgi:hypothetical protein
MAVRFPPPESFRHSVFQQFGMEYKKAVYEDFDKEYKKMTDPVNHPPHYKQHPSGIECIQITEHMGFNLGNAIKYIWRADLKNDAIEDLRKARWYIDREIQKRVPK